MPVQASIVRKFFDVSIDYMIVCLMFTGVSVENNDGKFIQVFDYANVYASWERMRFLEGKCSSDEQLWNGFVGTSGTQGAAGSPLGSHRHPPPKEVLRRSGVQGTTNS